MSRAVFYLVPDAHPDDEYVNTFEAECVGDLTMNQFIDWQGRNILTGDVTFYDSFRIKSAEVQELLKIIEEKQFQPVDENDRLILMLKDAAEMNEGLYIENEGAA